jgi:hypothetical protein
MRQPLRSIGSVLVKIRRDDGHSERPRDFRATFRHFRKPLGDKAVPICPAAMCDPRAKVVRQPPSSASMVMARRREIQRAVEKFNEAIRLGRAYDET